MATDASPLERLHAAVQEFSNAMAEDTSDAGVVSSALVVWEERSYGDGEPQVECIYASTGTVSLSGAMGLVEHARVQLAAVAAESAPGL